MPNAAAAADSASRIRKERLHNTMLVEVLALLVFMAMAFAFVMKEEGDRTNPWMEKAVKLEQQVRVLERANRELKIQVGALKRQIAQLEDSIRQLVAEHQGTLPPEGYVTLPRASVGASARKAQNVEALLEEAQADSARLRAELAALKGGKGGVGLPNCAVSAGFLLTIDVFGDGAFRAHPAWNAGAIDLVGTVPGAIQLSGGAALSRAQFGSLASQMSAWGRRQAPPCAFRVTVKEHHGNLTLYKKQVAAIEQYFYVRRN